MKTKIRPIMVTHDNPFVEDLLNRQESVEILSQLIKTTADPFVLAINSPWGTGKTTFIKMLKEVLSRDDVPCLYFNAWENDFTDDPLVALISEIGNIIEELTTKKKSKAERYFKKTKRYGAKLIKSALPAALKITTAGVP